VSVGGRSRDRHAAGKHLFFFAFVRSNNRYRYHFILWKNDDGPIIALSIIVDVPSTFFSLFNPYLIRFLCWFEEIANHRFLLLVSMVQTLSFRFICNFVVFFASFP
jgi:hypothetical protein